MATPTNVNPSAEERTVDVVVIGAGASGLMAARTLKKAGKSVCVLEARNRVGGRTWNGRVRDDNGVDHFVELGGQWISPDQTRLIELVDELGLSTFQRYREGKSIYLSPNGERHEYEGPVFPAADSTQAEMDKLIKILDDLAAEIGAKEPWAHPKAPELDSISFRHWLEQQSDDEEAIDNISIYVASGMLTKPSFTFSALQAVLMAASAGSFSNLVDEDFILDRRVEGGMMSVSETLAAELGDDVFLGTPVREIQWAQPDPSTEDSLNNVKPDVRNGIPNNGEPGEVTVVSEQVTVRAKNVVIAVPPNLYNRISYVPPMPRDLHIAHQHISMGLVIKVHAIYETPFWRDKGLSGTGFGGGRQGVVKHTRGCHGRVAGDDVLQAVPHGDDEFGAGGVLHEQAR